MHGAPAAVCVTPGGPLPCAGRGVLLGACPGPPDPFLLGRVGPVPGEHTGAGTPRGNEGHVRHFSSQVGSGRARSLRLSAAALAAVVGAAPLLTPAGARAPASPLPCSTQVPSTHWYSLPAARFSSGPQQITAYSINAAVPEQLLVTNGVAIMRSLDGGCSWSTAYELPAAGSEGPSLDASEPRDSKLPTYTSATARIGTIRSLGPAVFALIQEHTPVARPHLLVSSDFGGSWQHRDLPLAGESGTPLDVAVGFDPASGTSYIYLLVDQGQSAAVASVRRPVTLLVSEDFGYTWERRGEGPGETSLSAPVIGDVPPSEELSGLHGVASPYLLGRTVFVYGEAGLYRSDDAGHTLTRVDTNLVPGRVGDLEALALPTKGGTRLQLTAYSLGSPFAFRSLDGGAHFQSFSTPTEVESSSLDAISGPAGVFLEIGALNLPVYLNLGAPLQLHDLQGAFNLATRERLIIGAGNDALYWRRPFEVIPLEEVTERPALAEIPDTIVKLSEPRFRHPVRRIVLDRGEQRKVRYRLDLPPTPTPVDVFFLIDVSGSMQDTIDGVRRALFSIINQLRLEGVDVWFGVGEYRSYTQPPAYKRRLDISPPGPRLRRALNSLFASGGQEETQLMALYQVATGEGIDEPNHHITPGQQANFRSEAEKVIIHATDAQFSTGDGHPTFEQVAAALNAKGIKQIGIAVGDCEPNQRCLETPLEGLRRVADDTDTTAPPQGVDCDGDGDTELYFQEPLACRLDRDEVDDAATMAAVIVNTIRALRDDGAVRFRAEGPAGVVRSVTPTQPRIVNFKQPQVLDYHVTYSCPRLKPGRHYRVRLQAARASGVLAALDVKVICRSAEPEPPVVPFVAPVAAVFPPPRPPQPPNPNPNPQANPNPQPNPNPQSAFATQEQEQPQLAVAHAAGQRAEARLQPERGFSHKGSDEYAFARYKGARAGPPYAFLSLTVAMTFMLGTVLLARQRAAVRRIHIRRS